ncbi:reactive intermediate/imine deaminase [Prauserella marina]|uniref:Reactive intermediate/imine deaminase n=1 Tax=Prauserella marina TaxID=530584 RepID=A0A222VT74_9PSEU|nr:Rid family detoxifying hydrolase [Prauserella marina]ASR37114.1 reactive intermediate/imine deaminase [Prauserella marina]PWV72421.1 reactive intermediate/imine deaminase [Prauserella marina]SDD80455.1 reactive intermediate/imine deaminase [Prauserella marina]
MTNVAISTENAPEPVAAYSQARRKGNILQIAGQVGMDPETKRVPEGVAAQTRQVFANIEAILEAAGASFADVVMMRVYLTDTAHFAELNETYNALVLEPRPARTTVYVGLPEGLLVEIDALAVLDD